MYVHVVGVVFAHSVSAGRALGGRKAEEATGVHHQGVQHHAKNSGDYCDYYSKIYRFMKY